MSQYKPKTGKIGEKIVGAYKKVEDAIIDTKRIDDCVRDFYAFSVFSPTFL